jgi:hypothetical protein
MHQLPAIANSHTLLQMRPLLLNIRSLRDLVTPLLAKNLPFVNEFQWHFSPILSYINIHSYRRSTLRGAGDDISLSRV